MVVLTKFEVGLRAYYMYDSRAAGWTIDSLSNDRVTVFSTIEYIDHISSKFSYI